MKNLEKMSQQYYQKDMMLFFLNETSALHPKYIQPEGNQIPEAYPFGM
ncbi:hypothetical protein [Flavobacterium urumqiense]|nr:hypothetical protein [Flavobacterium urumqiense]